MREPTWNGPKEGRARTRIVDLVTRKKSRNVHLSWSRFAQILVTHIHVCWEQGNTSNELLPRNLSLVKQSDPEEEEACC